MLHQLTTYPGAREAPAGKEDQKSSYQVNNTEDKQHFYGQRWVKYVHFKLTDNYLDDR